MNKIREILLADYDKISEQINKLDLGDEKYKWLLEERDKIRNELLKMDLAEKDADVKKYQSKAEDKRDMIRNAITVGTFCISTIVSIVALNKTFRFDADATITSTMGRGIVNGFIPTFKMFKR